MTSALTTTEQKAGAKAPATTQKLKSYRVSLVVWYVYDYWTEAPNSDEAERLARDEWFDGDRSAFKHRHGEIESVEAEIAS